MRTNSWTKIKISSFLLVDVLMDRVALVDGEVLTQEGGLYE